MAMAKLGDSLLYLQLGGSPRLRQRLHINLDRLHICITAMAKLSDNLLCLQIG